MTFPNKPNPIKDPESVIVMRQYRKALDAREDELMRDMARRWLEIEFRLDADISALSYEMTRRAEAGERITQQMVWRNERYKVIRAQMEEQIRIYNRDYAVGAISKAQLEIGTLGIRSAQDSIFVSFGPMGGQFDRIGIEAVKSGIGFAGDGSPLYKLLKNDYPDAVNGLLRALVNGVARGQGPAQTARDMADGMGIGLERAVKIARTETARMYRTASVEQYRQSGVTAGFQRLVKKETACLACLALDGQVFDVLDDFTDHVLGKCQPVPIIEGVTPSRWQTGPEWFDTLDPQEQEARLGPARYKLWKDGQIQFSDLATIQHNDTWGSSPQVTPVKDL